MTSTLANFTFFSFQLCFAAVLTSRAKRHTQAVYRVIYLIFYARPIAKEQLRITFDAFIAT